MKQCNCEGLTSIALLDLGLHVLETCHRMQNKELGPWTPSCAFVDKQDAENYLAEFESNGYWRICYPTSRKMNDMELQPHQQRVVDEKRELDEKMGKLRAFINESPVFKELLKFEQKRLERQSLVMAEYSEILAERIAAFTITNQEAPRSGKGGMLM